jgi:hypothetical protein
MAGRKPDRRISRFLGPLIGFLGITGVGGDVSAASPDVVNERERLERRVLAARELLGVDRAADRLGNVVDKIAQWMNWPNWGNWGNWPNWNNWNNWGNWWNR